MPGLEIVAFSDRHLDAAAELLCERHERHREAEPRLPDGLDLRAEIEALWRRDGASGAATESGYVIGTPLDDELWGPNMWVELAGHAARDPELVRDLYAFLAEQWVAAGRVAHYVWVPASDTALVDAWFRLGFGAQQALAIRELEDEPVVEVSGVTVREATADDVDALVELAPVLNGHLALAPVFSRRPPWPDDETRAEIVVDLDNPKIGNLVAEIDGRIVANFVVVPVELSSAHSGLARPPGASMLGFAATLPEARGSGAGLALTSMCFAWARDRGYDLMVTDWRVTNLLSSRFWLARGFRPTFLRLHRYIA